MTVPSAVAPAVSPFRTILLGFLFLAQTVQQQVIDTGQPWDKSQLIPTNLVYEQRDISYRVNDNSSLTSPDVDNNSKQIFNNEDENQDEETDFDESYDYSAEFEDEEDPAFIQNRETFAVERISKEKVINETTILHSGESNATDYPEYHYYEYDYDNYTNFENEDSAHFNENTTEDYVENTSSEEYKAHKLNDNSANNSILIGEAIVSVVTTKSVVNGTFSVPVTPLPQTTEQLVSPQYSIYPLDSTSVSPVTESSSFTTEDADKVLASVQTVRSISGARFLPFPGIDPLNTHHSETTSHKAITYSLPSESSTESIIDKLDRVQSELSSGFLATSFGSSGNTMKIDSVNSGKPPHSVQKVSPTLKTPVISKFIPKRYNDRRLNKPPTVIQNTFKQEKPEQTKTGNQPDEASRRNDIKTQHLESSSAATITTDTTNLNQEKLKNLSVVVQDISAFLPPGYKLKQEATTEKTLLSQILNKSHLDISAFLPPGYKKENQIQKATQPVTQLTIPNLKSSAESLPPTTPSTIEKSTRKPTSIQDLFAKSEVDLSALLPKDYKQRFKVPDVKGVKIQNEGKRNENSTVISTTELSTTKSSGIKLVFPSRPGGRKSIAKVTVPSNPKGDGPGPVTPRIQKGWPTRVTTEFTGWPKPSTTPISIEKLLEAARTATVSSLDNTSVTLSTSIISTTSTTTSTTTSPKPTTPGICDEECKVAGTIRLVGNATWVPELLDRNTREWQDLADKLEKEMNFVFSKSNILKTWFKDIKIDSFSEGSILADYFIELVDVQKPVDTQQLKRIFHDSLQIYSSNRYNDTMLNSTMKLGPFMIDPKFTDFIVIPKASIPQHIENNKLIPQWVIAVIIIGVGGLLFIIVFGVSVIANRQNGSKLKPSMSAMYGEEISKSTIHTSSSAPSMQRSNDYPKSNNSMWNESTPTWTHEKVFESTSNKVLMETAVPFDNDKRYNLYDSWRSEWNGYYYNPSQMSNRYARYDSNVNLSRQHPDYDTNF